MMGDRREDYTNLSLMISHVMDDVGLNEECVLKRRRVNLVSENIWTFKARTRQYTSLGTLHLKGTCHIFGSQTEGTTTDGLNSDTDILGAVEAINVIQDWKDWVPGKLNFLMIRDERKFPGHCKLQYLRPDVPLPSRGVIPPFLNNFNVHDDDGNVMFTSIYFQCFEGSVRNGPAATLRRGCFEQDTVPAWKCHTWPEHFKQWALSERRRDWPTPEMIHYMKSTGCFVVKAAHQLDDKDETWRISTSLAERCLMFSLNITQIRCYVLLKMIVRTFIQPHLPNTISSYMCKTLMFHAIENTRKEIWKEHNLVQCVHQVLLYMIAAVLDENCPNYFNKASNLFLGKVSGRNKAGLLRILRNLMRTKGGFLLKIHLDQVNDKLTMYMTGTISRSVQNDVVGKKKIVLKSMIYSFFSRLSNLVFEIRLHQPCSDDILTVSRDLIKMGHIQSKAVGLILPFMCSHMASTEASKSIIQGTEPTPVTLKLFDLSLNSDVASSRLKFASYLYCTGQRERTLSVLQDVEERMTDSVMMVCGCGGMQCLKYPSRFAEREVSQQYPTTDRLALCVMFVKDESRFCPRELQYGMLRPTNQGRRKKTVYEYFFTNQYLAGMDAYPYLYYLKYMTYRHLGKHDQQYTALNKLCDCVRNNKYLAHRTIAYNVLGQCMEYEGWLDDAFECYRRSLRIRPDATCWHIIRLKARLARQRTPQS